jgi:HEAT repeat protein
MRVATIASLLALALLENAALAGDPAEKRVQEWIRHLKSDPVASRRKLIHDIREEANQGDRDDGEEPPNTTDRPDLIPVLEVALSDEDEQVRSDAIGALKYMRHPKAYPVLERALKSEHSTVKFFAIQSIGWLGDLGIADLRSNVVASLAKVRAEKEEHPYYSLLAGSELVRLGVETDLQIFYDALRRKTVLPTCAVDSLAKLGRKDALELMIAAMREARPSHDYWIGKNLQKLTGQTIGGDNPKSDDADEWQKWLDANRAKLPEQVR